MGARKLGKTLNFGHVFHLDSIDTGECAMCSKAFIGNPPRPCRVNIQYVHPDDTIHDRGVVLGFCSPYCWKQWAIRALLDADEAEGAVEIIEEPL